MLSSALCPSDRVARQVYAVPSSPILPGLRVSTMELSPITVSIASLVPSPTRNHSIFVTLASPFHEQTMSRDTPMISGSSWPVMSSWPAQTKKSCWRR
ncbi:hypothetical protein GBAR_LOCUS27614 [Geodia barretti]|uniref:Uncharacterized protein n=1 Tax=Geodia barretti TaxID=519541 RepID=A0AA35TME0_GEOBA|nr:hypothetical protein GBAR_LOCUS27614 [Geodia barretti]